MLHCVVGFVIPGLLNTRSASSLTVEESTQNSSSKSRETQTQGHKVIPERTCTNKQPKRRGKLNLALFYYLREN